MGGAVQSGAQTEGKGGFPQSRGLFSPHSLSFFLFCSRVLFPGTQVTLHSLSPRGARVPERPSGGRRVTPEPHSCVCAARNGGTWSEPAEGALRAGECGAQGGVTTGGWPWALSLVPRVGSA